MIAESLLRQIEIGRSGKQWGYSMGLPKLEEIIDGVSRGVYTLVFSPTGSGKSSLALYSYVYRPLMEHLDDGNFKVSYFSLEMSAEMIYAKLLSMYIFETYGIELSTKELLSKKKNYKLSLEYYKMVQDCMPWLKKVEKVLTIYDKSLSAGSLYTILMKELEKCGKFEDTGGRKIYHPDNENLVHLVVIDHLSLVRRSEGRTLKEEMDLISSYLVTLRNMCKISPLVIMQANRNSTSMDRRKEGLNNLRIDDTKDTGAPKINFISNIKHFGFPRIKFILEMFKSKFDLEFTVHANHVIRLKKKDATKFCNLVRPYIHEDCLYKLGLDAPKTPLNGESPEMDNPVLNP